MALTAAQAGRFKDAMALVRSGRLAEALAAARMLMAQAPGAADAFQLLAICLAECGDDQQAEAAFRKALELAPQADAAGLNFCAWLVRRGRIEDARGVLASMPETAQVLVQRGRLALRVHDPGAAREAFERAVRLDPGSRQAWLGLGGVLRALGLPEASEGAFRRATDRWPDHAPAWAGLGGVLRSMGRIDEALACLETARQLGDARPELQDAINGVLQDAGRPAEALAGARTLLHAHPAHPEAHASLAHLLWEHGAELAPGEDPFAVFAAATRTHPGHRELHLRLAGMLTSAGRADDALSVLASLRATAGDDPVVRWFQADAWDRLGQHATAAPLYASASGTLGKESPSFLNAYARHAFRSGEPGLAERCARAALALAPTDQEAWSHLGTCWRLAGDPREDWLFGYDRLVGEIEVEPPPGFDGLHAFLARLSDCLSRMHRSGREPVNQSVRHGSQTPGRLFGRDDPALRALEATMRRAVEGWIARLPDDPAHPFLSRRRRSVRFVGSWSVRLRSSGRHANHIHNEGWASSAFYAALPPSVQNAAPGDHAGWIQFGAPLEDLKLDLPPRRMIQPRPGHLVLFPSYMWHGTLPFSDVAPRITVAFDMQPA